MNRQEFLQDTINYYWGKPERKCTNNTGKCLYAPASDNTLGCAIGRHLPLELSKHLDSGNDTDVANPEIFDQLPDWMKALGIQFLTEVQSLHDTGKFAERVKRHILETMEFLVDMNSITFPEEP